jgi:hypothetical protein
MIADCGHCGLEMKRDPFFLHLPFERKADFPVELPADVR